MTYFIENRNFRLWPGEDHHERQPDQLDASFYEGDFVPQELRTDGVGEWSLLEGSTGDGSASAVEVVKWRR